MSQPPAGQNPKEFDPYHQWLGIPPGTLPPSHYQLLGVSPDESDLKVIHSAGLRQSAYVRNFQSGAHADAASRILSELAEARSTLTNASRRKKYDACLSASAATPRQVKATPDEPIAVREDDGLRFDGANRRTRKASSLPFIAIAVTLLVVLVIGGVLLSRSSRQPLSVQEVVESKPPQAALPETNPKIVPPPKLEATKVQPVIPTDQPKSGPVEPMPPTETAVPIETAPMPQIRLPEASAIAQADDTAWLKGVKQKHIHVMHLQVKNTKNDYKTIACDGDEAGRLLKHGWRNPYILGGASIDRLPNTIPLWRHKDADMLCSYYLSDEPRETTDIRLGYVWNKKIVGLDGVMIYNVLSKDKHLGMNMIPRRAVTSEVQEDGKLTFYVISPFVPPADPLVIHKPLKGSGKWELVPSGSFENGMEGWSDMHPGQTLGNYVISKAKVFEGTASMISVPKKTFATNGFAVKSSPIAGRFTYGQQYVLSAAFNTSGMSSGSLCVFVRGYNEKVEGVKLAAKPGVEGWQFISASFTATHPTLMVYVTRDGKSIAGEAGFVDAIAVTPKDKFIAPKPSP